MLAATNVSSGVARTALRRSVPTLALRRIQLGIRSESTKTDTFQSHSSDSHSSSDLTSSSSHVYEISSRDSDYTASVTSSHGNAPSIARLDETLQQLQSKPVDFHYYLRSLHKIQREDKLPYKFGHNQLHQGSRTGTGMDGMLEGILNRFDQNRVGEENDMEYAFGYGSKIFSQGSGVDSSNSQIDMIYAVRDPVEWHRRNIVNNGGDYSIMKHLGPHAINYVTKMGAGVYFNPFVDVNVKGIPLELKYGVTSTQNLADDLTNWSSMYLAGRLHKPVAIVENTPQLLFLNQFNLANAVKLSILLLNQKRITESELYLTIAGLSYMGDPRLKVKGENPDKVKNIVDNQFALFQNLYQPILDNYFPELLQCTNSESDDVSEKTYTVNLTEEQIAHVLIELPRQFRARLFNLYISEHDNVYSKDRFAQDVITSPKHTCTLPGSSSSSGTTGGASSISYSNVRSARSLSDLPSSEWEYMTTSVKVDNSPYVRLLAHEMYGNPELLKHALSSTIETTVGESALVQSVKGILTAGLMRSWKYAMAKRSKYTQALRKKEKKQH